MNTLMFREGGVQRADIEALCTPHSPTYTHLTLHISSIWQFQSCIHYNKTAIVRIELS